MGTVAMSSQLLASGTGWRVSDFVCTAGPKDRPYVEQHADMCIALVTDGSFHYTTTQGSAVMAPGSLMLGNAGACFECGHEHGMGDRCLSFQFTPEFFESIAATVPGSREIRFAQPRLPLVPEILPIIAMAEAMRRDGDDGPEFFELTLRLAGAVCRSLSPAKNTRRAPTDRDKKRIVSALRRIEAEPTGRLSLQELAAEAATTPYHFLRVFEQVVGITPGQYILRTRLRRAAIQLRGSSDSIMAVAFEAGFRDLSTFNRHFRRLMGATPSAFRSGLSLR